MIELRIENFEQNEIQEQLKYFKLFIKQSSYILKEGEEDNNEELQANTSSKINIAKNHNAIVFSDIHGDLMSFLMTLTKLGVITIDKNKVRYINLNEISSKIAEKVEIKEISIDDLEKKLQDNPKLEIIISPIINYCPENQLTIYILGDLIDRGLESLMTLDCLKQLAEQLKKYEKQDLLKIAIGNHEINMDNIFSKYKTPFPKEKRFKLHLMNYNFLFNNGFLKTGYLIQDNQERKMYLSHSILNQESLKNFIENILSDLKEYDFETINSNEDALKSKIDEIISLFIKIFPEQNNIVKNLKTNVFEKIKNIKLLKEIILKLEEINNEIKENKNKIAELEKELLLYETDEYDEIEFNNLNILNKDEEIERIENEIKKLENNIKSQYFNFKILVNYFILKRKFLTELKNNNKELFNKIIAFNNRGNDQRFNEVFDLEDLIKIKSILGNLIMQFLLTFNYTEYFKSIKNENFYKLISDVFWNREIKNNEIIPEVKNPNNIIQVIGHEIHPTIEKKRNIIFVDNARSSVVNKMGSKLSVFTFNQNDLSSINQDFNQNNTRNEIIVYDVFYRDLIGKTGISLGINFTNSRYYLLILKNYNYINLNERPIIHEIKQFYDYINNLKNIISKKEISETNINQESIKKIIDFIKNININDLSKTQISQIDILNNANKNTLDKIKIIDCKNGNVNILEDFIEAIKKRNQEKNQIKENQTPLKNTLETKKHSGLQMKIQGIIQKNAKTQQERVAEYNKERNLGFKSLNQ